MWAPRYWLWFRAQRCCRQAQRLTPWYHCQERPDILNIYIYISWLDMTHSHAAAAAWLSVLFSSINPAGSARVQEHGQVYHPPGYCAALWGNFSCSTCNKVEHHGNENTFCCQGFEMRHLICLSVGSHRAETRNNPLEKENRDLHGLKPGTFVSSLSRYSSNNQKFYVLCFYVCSKN